MKDIQEDQPQTQVEEYDPSILPNVLPIYFKRLFPHKLFYKWLSYGEPTPSSVFVNREISFTIDDDIYIRYLSFENDAELEKEINSKAPNKIDIGAVFSSRPKHHRSTPRMLPVEREIVFDIDLSDYNPVRTCCQGNSICQKCWKFMVVSVKVLDTAVREDFGFEHIFWVFSGRRGIHAWICDPEARKLDNKARSAFADYMSLITFSSDSKSEGEQDTIARVTIGDKMHHSVKRALKIIEPHFEEVILIDQNLFGQENGILKLIQVIPDENARKEAEQYLRKFEGKSSKEIWDAFVKYANSMRTSQSGSVWNRKLKYIVEEVQIALMYPRLDINVTKGINHLLKSPFVIHPATGKVCVPFSAQAVSKFDPNAVPTINQLLEDINKYDEERKDQNSNDDKSNMKEYRKTGMLKGVKVFEEFLRKMYKGIGKDKFDF
ncbi:PRIM1 family protein [Megaselia abdita]